MVREMVPPLEAKSTFAVAVADVVGLNRTVTPWLAPTPTRVNALPVTMLKGAEVDTVPEIGLTAKSIRATALAGVAQALSLPPEGLRLGWKEDSVSRTRPERRR